MVTSVVLIIRRMCDKYIEEDTPQQNLRGWGGGWGIREKNTGTLNKEKNWRCGQFTMQQIYAALMVAHSKLT